MFNNFVLNDLDIYYSTFTHRYDITIFNLTSSDRNQSCHEQKGIQKQVRTLKSQLKMQKNSRIIFFLAANKDIGYMLKRNVSIL
jgi:hypothetical protein